jgi:hypothetical protein
MITDLLELRPDYMRLCKPLNPRHPANRLFFPLRHLITKYFGEITQDVQALRRAYVATRLARTWTHPGSERAGHVRDENSFTSNGPTPQSDIDGIQDSAQYALLKVLERMRNAICAWSSTVPSAAALVPTERLCFLEGKIGVGKSTLLHHLDKVVIPHLAEGDSAALGLRPIIINLNNIHSSDNSDVVWQSILQLTRQEVERVTGLTSGDDWEQLANPEIYDSDKKLLGRVSWAPDVTARIREIVQEANDDVCYIRRVGRLLTSRNRREILILIFDNLDIHLGLPRQIEIIKRIHALLAKCPCVGAIVSIRTRNLNRLLQFRQEFREYFITQTITISNPMLGPLVQRRIDMCLEDLRDQPEQPISVQLRPGITLKAANVQEILRHVGSAFANSGWLAGAHHSNFGDDHPATFFQCNTDGNSRECLEAAQAMLSSWALDVDVVILRYFNLRTHARRRGQDAELPRFKIDEVVRLLAVDQYQYYDRELCHHLFNVFSANHRCVPSQGRFPCLIMYRLLQFLGKRRCIRKADLQDAFYCYQYSIQDIDDLLNELLVAKFVESDDGDVTSEIVSLYPTDKVDYYIRYLSRTLTYLENVRNDTPVNYIAKPHEVRSQLVGDVEEAFKFIGFICDHERQELAYILSREPADVERFRGILTEEPIAFRLFRSVIERCNNLYDNRADLFSRDLTRLTSMSRNLREELHALISNPPNLYPAVDLSRIEGVRLSWDTAGYTGGSI